MEFPRRLIDGYHAFLGSRLPIERSRYEKLAETGQQPETMIISCCDSRVSPEVIFDAHPGELFVVRNVANLVSPYSPTGFTHGNSAALEFAVLVLEVKYIVVLGHTHCGGVRAFVEHENRPAPQDFIDNWMSLIAPAAEAAGERDVPSRADFLARLEQASIVVTLENLRSFPWVRTRTEQQELRLIGAYFDVGTGCLEVYDSQAGAFKPIVSFGSHKLADLAQA
jgi:carbonic anhydrase